MNAPEEAAPDLVGRVVMGVVHVRAGCPHVELVGERVAGLDRVLGDVRDAVHVVRHALAVEVDAGRLVQVVLEDRPDPVAFDDVDPRRRPRPVVAEGRDRILDGVDPMLDLVDRQLEDLDAVLDPDRRQRLVPGALERRALAVEEPLDDGQGGGVVVDRRRRRRRAGRLGRCRLMAGVLVRARRRGRRRCRGRRRAGWGERPRRLTGRGHAGGHGHRDQAAAGQSAGPQQGSSAEGGRRQSERALPGHQGSGSRSCANDRALWRRDERADRHRPGVPEVMDPQWNPYGVGWATARLPQAPSW